eukprot:2185939-Pyramimonas_sp.AAC.1
MGVDHVLWADSDDWTVDASIVRGGPCPSHQHQRSYDVRQSFDGQQSYIGHQKKAGPYAELR